MIETCRSFSDVLLLTLPAVALPVFIAGFMFGQSCAVKALLEDIGPIFSILILTISNAILLKTFTRQTGQKPLVQNTVTRLLCSPSTDDLRKDKEGVMDIAVPSKEVPHEVVDLSGTYKLESKANFEEFLASQGVGWAIRKAADKAVPTNVITHNLDEHTVTIRVEGIISSQTTYKINGDPLETRIQSRVFLDTMKYLESGDGVQVTKVCGAEGYHIFVRRQLSSCKQILTVTSTAVWPGKQVESQQVFRKLEN